LESSCSENVNATAEQNGQTAALEKLVVVATVNASATAIESPNTDEIRCRIRVHILLIEFN
jgi:predicted pyridoxine 5'-phosphate oxidase superfamily flavin-nucleotide-binding protein